MVTEIEKVKLIKAALKAMERAYAPYSGFRVGSAILSKDGKIFWGCNVENSSYGLTICAERVALFSAVANGCREFEVIAVVGDSSDFIYPCGACRQTLYEFSEDLLVIMAKPDGSFIERRLKDLLPWGFKLIR